ncbi:hypothetical protein KAFR_0K01320 [Kazachstania africana CBS 2517]|uniref:Nitrogen regulatory protein areA GATA-like domain-containing protein n=1 Tax=Kazachstania africana (strain ATCC 22294 / BCRC 22015 / CBS 2517 / CECT 1963 / NBRC 1671 / NRRL Y-8276) TaxID=1071382 RepID=H2B1I6_KAZAF|nr:hypothetical protein KAFR_0K01320 [Kazachstania africana CBS 2517]CCF60486.1 hypothetical protein KAFR_0K01320 [Kazachstania africana CBS 2517]
MTSLDDSIISQQNMMLLDNVTNYKKTSLDYFHYSFNEDSMELPLSWSLLLKMRKHKLLRLPSCSIEDDSDYMIYIERLHHILWRRWSSKLFHLDDLKLDPLEINWKKETDVTVLYGPDLICHDEISCPLYDIQYNYKQSTAKQDVPFMDTDESDFNYSSSVDSSTSSIFDNSNSNTSPPKIKKCLKFNDRVDRRDINLYGEFIESSIKINDRKHRHHRHRHQRHSSSNQDKSAHILTDDEINKLRNGNNYVLLK